MPYEIRERKKGFQVCKKGSRRCYSNDPLPLNKAKRQLRALYSAEADMEGAGFFGNLLKRTFTGITDFIVRPRGYDPSKHTQGWLRRPFDMPPLEDLAKMVASTYKEGDPQIQGYNLLLKTPTVSFFQVDRKKNVIIIALRGTAFTDINDISADLGIVKTIVEDAKTARSVRNSQRYINDVKTIKDFQSKPARFYNTVYYAVGHSLSGAMIDELLDDGLVKSAVSFNPAIERVNFAKDNNNHRVYLSCDVLYNLLGKFITNGNLEVVEKENPAGADAGAIDASKGTIKCHNIETVIPYMSGKGIENNFSNEYKPMSFQDLINRSSSFRGDKFKPIGRQTKCMATMEYAPCFDEEGNMYNNPSSARCAGKKCVSNARSVARGGGFLDAVGKFMSFAEKGRKQEAEELDENWRGTFGRIGIPNPMKLFGGAREVSPPPRPPPPRPPRPVVPLNRGVITRVNAEMRRLTNLDNGNHAGRFFLRSILQNYYRVVLRNYVRSTTANRANALGYLLNNMVGMTSVLVGGEDANTVRDLNSAVADAVLRADGEDED
jgi:hypothetical protein